jgi:hypothetical protein
MVFETTWEGIRASNSNAVALLKATERVEGGAHWREETRVDVFPDPARAFTAWDSPFLKAVITMSCWEVFFIRVPIG